MLLCVGVHSQVLACYWDFRDEEWQTGGKSGPRRPAGDVALFLRHCLRLRYGDVHLSDHQPEKPPGKTNTDLLAGV